jgi:hypothetical protein
MRPTKGIIFFGVTEIAIGTITLGAIIYSLITHTSTKPFNVLIFVIISGLISTGLGTGILSYEKYARKLLMFFAGWIILSKILIFTNIMTLNGSFETVLPAHFKNAVSIIYHLLIILFFHHPAIKGEFEK